MEKALFAPSVLLALLAAPAKAHHSFPGIYDTRQEIVLQGQITRFLFRNPHTFVFLAVARQDGTAEEWHLEMPPAWALNRRGLSKNLFKPDDALIVVCNPARDGRRSCGVGRTGGIFRASDGFLYGRDPRTVKVRGEDEQ